MFPTDRQASQMSDVRERADERRLQRSEESMQTNLLVRNRWSAATLRVLSSMPSRSVGETILSVTSRFVKGKPRGCVY